MTAVDPVAAPLAGALLGALLTAFDGDEVEPVCAAGLTAGAMVIADHCCADTTADGTPCQGQLTVRVEDVFPTEVFPEPRATAIPVCGTSWAVRCEVAVIRCALAMDDYGNPPSAEAETAVADRALGDAAVVRAALLGFARDRDQALVLGGYTPLGPDGGCVGGTTIATFLVE